MFEGFTALEIHSLSPVTHIAEFGHKEKRITAEIVKKTFGFVVNLPDKFVGICNHRTASDEFGFGEKLFSRNSRAFALEKSCLVNDFVCKFVSVTDDYFG